MEARVGRPKYSNLSATLGLSVRNTSRTPAGISERSQVSAGRLSRYWSGSRWSSARGAPTKPLISTSGDGSAIHCIC